MIQQMNKETLDKLKIKFINILKEVEGTEQLIINLESKGFFDYPAAMRYHGAFKCGLLAHSMATYYLFKSRVKQLKSDCERRTIILVPLLHDVCKLQEYRLNSITNEYEYSANRFDSSHGTKSIILIKEFGFELNEKEQLLIKYHMGIYQTSLFKKPNEEYSLEAYHSAIYKDPLVLVFHNCDNESAKFIC